MEKSQIADATPAYYSELAEFYNAIYTDDTLTIETFIEADKQRNPKYKFKRWVTIKDDRVVGTGMYFQREWFYHPQKFRISVLVTPEHRKQGIGSALYDQIIRGLQALNPLDLITDTYENIPAAIRFLEKRGFEEFIRDRELRLDLRKFDIDPYSDYEERLRARGIELKSATNLANDPNRNQKLFALDNRISKDAPQSEYAPERTLEDYVEFAITGNSALPDGFFVAVHDDDYVGFTQFMPSGDDALYQLLTGVRGDYRRKGIALALKLRGIMYAKEMGKQTIITNNDPSNRPMLMLNKQLGFVPQLDKIFFKKEF
jgi:GNAT superfamily N-acetyltransferase